MASNQNNAWVDSSLRQESPQDLALWEPTFPSQPVSHQQTPRTFRGKKVKPKNANLPDSVLAYKERRKTGTVVSSWVGGTVGLVLLGPIGAAVGASAGYGISKSIGKAKERKLIEQHHTGGTLTQQRKRNQRDVAVNRGQFV